MAASSFSPKVFAEPALPSSCSAQPDTLRYSPILYSYCRNMGELTPESSECQYTKVSLDSRMNVNALACVKACAVKLRIVPAVRGHRTVGRRWRCLTLAVIWSDSQAQLLQFCMLFSLEGMRGLPSAPRMWL